MRFFGIGKKELSDTELRDALFNAVAAKKTGELRKLVTNHLARIQVLFLSWRTVPEDIRKSPVKAKWWAEGVIGIATTVAEQGDKSLLTILQGKPEDNPLVFWPNAMQAAQAEVDRGNYVEGIRILKDILKKVSGLTGTGVDAYLPKTYGLLGIAYFKAGNKEFARRYTIRAKEYCERNNDQEGVEIYTQNLAIINGVQR
jgi:hypothetical protein